MDEIKLTVRILSIVYRNDENGYCICTVREKNEGEFSVVGYLPSVTEGERICVTGKWVTHPIYGDQFKAEYYENVVPSGSEEILSYLSSGVIPGVREATAEKLVDAFKEKTLDVIMNEPERLTEIKGITLRRAKRISDSLREVQSMQSIIMFLQKYGVSANMAVKIHNAFGGSAVERISANPYLLSDSVDGISFKKADSIASLMGMPKNNPDRIAAGVKYILQNAAYAMGHTYLPEQALIRTASASLGVSDSETVNGINSLAAKKQLKPDTAPDGSRRYYLAYLFNDEEYTAARLISLSHAEQKNTMTEEQADEEIMTLEENEGINLADRQKEAVKKSLLSGVLVLTGGPGTGKTTTINAILQLTDKLGLKTALAAPTGRAAKRMSEVTGRDAQTIHRLLGASISPSGTNIFERDESDPLKEDVIIIDEVSMIDIQLMPALLKAVKPGARLILSGDADQLPPVGPGNVLRDLVRSEAVTTVRLDHVFRQAEQSLIVVNAHKINNGEMPVLTETKRDFFFLRRLAPEQTLYAIADLYQNRLPKSYGIDPFTEIQVLSPTKKGLLGTVSLNKVLQSRINPEDILKAEHAFGDTIFRTGDKVMQTKNNYDIVYEKDSGEIGTGIFNGDMGIIEDIDTHGKFLRITFDDEKHVEYPFAGLEDLELAYAITVHKSQGSEFPFMIMPVMDFPPMLMYRNLFYTAVTRAKTMVILVGKETAVERMISSGEKNIRCSGLYDRLEKHMKAGIQMTIADRPSNG